MRKLLVFALIGALVVVMLAAGALVVMNPSSASGAERLAYGQEIQIDDFAFAALDSQRAPTVGTATAQGIFYIVPFRVANHAKRVNFTFRPESIILIDAAGTEYHVSDAARQAWFTANNQTDGCAHDLIAGETCETTLVFDVPASTNAPYLRTSFGGQLFDAADALMYGNKVIQLK